MEFICFPKVVPEKDDMKQKLIRITTVPVSMNIILKGQLNFMNQFYEVIGITSYDEKHFNEIADREGVRMEAIEMSRTISLIKDFKALWRLYKFFIKERPEIVHTHTPKAGLLGMLAALFARVPVRLHTVGGMPLVEAKGIKRYVLSLTEKVTYCCAHKVYPNSKGLKEIIIDEGLCQASKLKVIANGGTNGVNVDFFKPDNSDEALLKKQELRQAIGISPEYFVFCFVGRIARDKGIDELLNAFQELQISYPVKLVLVGLFEQQHGVLGHKTREIIQNNKDILFLGRFDDVRPYYGISDVYVFPSYREGFPNSVLEAGAMGLPIIATDINGCNEIVKNNINGLLIAPKSSEQLRNAMVTLIEDSAIRVSLSSKSREIIIKQFSREFVWVALLKEYHSHLKHIPKKTYA